MPSRASKTRDQARDWTQGPAAWAPILLLLIVSSFGAVRAASTAETSNGAGLASAPLQESKIDINTAGAARLQLLPRIGPKLAARIVEDRDANGPFADSDDFQRVRGIGPKTAERIATVAEFSQHH